jgi:threonyl-tRNA synthetase
VGYRVEVGEPTETIGKRIRASELEKIPFTIVFGDRESEQSLAIRERGGDQTEETLTDFLTKLATLGA